MLCWHCGGKNTRVIATQPGQRFTRRYCKCLDCNGRFHTIERYERDKPGPLPGTPRKRNISRGEGHGAAVLTERDIVLIRELYQQGQTLTAIAKRFGVSRQHISKIANRKSWTHI